jgi:hypothetical protein
MICNLAGGALLVKNKMIMKNIIYHLSILLNPRGAQKIGNKTSIKQILNY